MCIRDRPYIDCIEETLSMNSIIARGKHVEMNVDAYLAEAEIMNQEPAV